jgi:hypothetical protein
VYFVRRARESGGRIQGFVHVELPHVFSAYEFPEIKSFEEGLREIEEFVARLPGVEGKFEQVEWDGSREGISDDDDPSISRDEVLADSVEADLVASEDGKGSGFVEDSSR